MNEHPLISVIMPTYNGALFIKKSIRAVLSQTFRDFELIIVNDASGNNTSEAISSFHDPRIVYIENKTNRGTSFARNRGLKIAKGKYIAYCDHDDIYYPNHLKALFNFLEKNTNIALAYSDYLLEKEGSKKIISRVFDRRRLEISCIFPPSTVMHLKACLDKSGLFSNDSLLKKNASAEDWDLWLKISDHYKLGRLDRVLTKVVIYDSNRTKKANFLRSYMHIIKVRFEKLRAESKLKASEYIKNNLMHIAELTFSQKFSKKEHLVFAGFFYKSFKNFYTAYFLGRSFLYSGDFVKAERALKEALRYASAKNDIRAADLNNTVYLLAKALFHLGKLAQAGKICEGILKKDRKNLATLETLIDILIRDGRAPEAAALIKKHKASKRFTGKLRLCYLAMGDVGRAYSKKEGKS